MNPRIPKIVFVGESLETAQAQNVEPYAIGVDSDQPAAVAVDGIFSAPDFKTVKMDVVPTKGDLQRLVQLRNRAVAAYQKAPPYQWADSAQDHAKLEDLDFRSSFYRHAASVHLCAAHPQLSAALLRTFERVRGPSNLGFVCGGGQGQAEGRSGSPERWQCLSQFHCRCHCRHRRSA